MGIFDRFAKGVEQRNVDAVYAAELERIDAAILEQRDQIVKIETARRVRAARGDGSDAGYAELVDQAKDILVQLEAQRRKLEQERLTAPARKAVAEGRIAVDEQSSGVGDSATARGLTAVRDQVESLKRRASPGSLDADGIPIHGRQAALDARARESRARDELARLKAALGKGDSAPADAPSSDPAPDPGDDASDDPEP